MNESTETKSGDLYESIKDQEVSQEEEGSQLNIMEGEGLKGVEAGQVAVSSSDIQRSKVMAGCAGPADELDRGNVDSALTSTSTSAVSPLPPPHVPQVS